jgi:hypothetical protein
LAKEKEYERRNAMSEEQFFPWIDEYEQTIEEKGMDFLIAMEELGIIKAHYFKGHIAPTNRFVILRR